MANYYVDYDGSITTDKKKKKKNKTSYYVDESGTITRETASDDDVAPVKETKKSEERTWFQSGAYGKLKNRFKDGYQFGDVAKTGKDLFLAARASEADFTEKLTSGILGIGEKMIDFGAMIGTAMNQGSLAQSAEGQMLYNVVSGQGEKNDDILKNNQKAQEELEKATADFVAKDLYNEEQVAKKIISEPFENVTGMNVETDSVLGDKSDALVQSAGQLVAQLGADYLLPGSGMLLMGATTFGSEAENAALNGADFDEALVSATISAGAEMLTEKIGGVKFGGKTLTDVVFGKLSSKMTNKLVKVLVTSGKIGAEALAEGGEEILSGYLSAIGQKLTYMKDKEIEELFSKDDKLESFIGGVVLGGTFSGGESLVSGRNAVNGLTKSDQAVVDKVYNDAIAETEKNGKKLTAKEKSKIYDEVSERLEKGDISIDTIEEVLGGKTLEEYKSLTDKENSLKEEIDQLENTPEQQFTIKQRERLTAAREELKNLANKDELKTKLSDEVYGIAQRGKLVESYNERARRGQAFEADLTQYEGKRREAIERAINSGVLNNTYRSHELVDILSKIEVDKGIVFDYTNNEKLKETGFAIEGKTVNGFVKDGGVTLNVQSSKAWQSTVGHEISHVLESTEAYGELRQAVFAYAESKGELASRKAALTELYNGMDADIDAELTADLIGEYLFTDKAFVDHLTGNRTLFQKIYDEIKYLCKVATGKELTEIEKVKREFDRAWKEYGNTTEQDAESNELGDTDVKYSLRKEAPPKETGIAYKVFYVKDGKLYPPMVANPDGADTPMGVWLNADVGAAAPPSKTGRAQVKAGGKGTQGGSGSLAFRPGWHLGDLPRASQFDRLNPETGKKELFPENFVWAEVEYAKDVDYQEEAMSYGYTENGKFRHAYAGLPKLPENGYYRYRTNPKPDTVPWVITGAMKVNRLLSDAEVNEILEKNGVPAVHRKGGDVGLDKFGFDESGKVKYSVSEDSEGNELSVAVQKRFANSKAVDENGNLKVLYHGTYNGEFYTFDKSKGSVEGDFGSGFYFTDSEYDVSDNYEGGGPDFENKVARLAEQIEAEEEIEYHEAEKRARDELYKGSFKHSVYLNIENPAIVGETTLFDYESFTEEYDREDYDSDEDYEGDVEQLIADNIDQIIWDVERNIDVYSTDGLADVLWNAVNEGGIDIEQLKANINNLYLEDSEGNLVGNEVTRQIIESLGYDGIIDNTVSTKFNMNLEEGTTHYIVFKPNQIKSIDNQNPTDNPDIRFSLSKAVEETKDLVALHNLTADKLTKSLELGGLPMPSLAITKSDIPHDNFGEITLIFDKKTIDSKANKKNKVYSADAWTPIFPNVEYEADSKVVNRASQKLRELEGMVDDEFVRDLSRIGYSIEDYLNRMGGEEGLIQHVMDNYGLKAAYLEDIGKHIEKVTKQEEVPRNFNPASADKYEKIMEILGINTVEDVYEINLKEARDNHGAELEAVFPGITHSALRMGKVVGMVGSYIQGKDSAPEYRTVTDSAATRKAVDDAIDTEGFEAWVRNLFSGVVKDSGIYNNKDLFTPSGNRRSFKQTHLPVTLENIVKVMASRSDKNDSSFNGVKTLRATTAETFKSIDDMHRRKDRLQHLTQEQADTITEGLQNRLLEVMTAIDNENSQRGDRNHYIRLDQIGETIAEIGENGKYGIADIQDTFSQYGRTISDDTAQSIKQLLYDVTQMPVNIFEAKPQRVVTFDEAKVFVIPNNVDAKLKQELLNRGYSIAEYDPNVEGDRNRVVNQFEEYKFSLSNVGEKYAPTGNFSTPMKELALEQDNAPVTDTNVGSNEMAEDIAPITAEEAEALNKASFDAITVADAPPEIDAPYYGDTEPVATDDPFDNRDMKQVGSQKVKAYMYENPEVKPYFQREAEIMLNDLRDSTKGERVVMADVLYETNGEAGIYGTKRHTAPEIAELLDEWGYTYDEISKGLKAIIEDNGKENNACSKRIEFMLHNRLMYGYQDFILGFDIPANEEYVNLIKEKQITEYNEEAFNSYMASVGKDIDNIAPPSSEVETPFPDEIAPMTEEEANAIQDEKAKSDAKAEGEPKTRKQLHSNIINDMKATFSSGGYDLDDVLKKAKDLSTFSTVDNTPQRVMEKALGYKEGQILSDMTVNKVAQNETEGIKWLNSFTDRKNGLLAQLSKQYNIKPGSKQSAAAQMYAEGFYVNDDNDIIKYGDAELARDFPDVRDQNNIKGLANDPRIRQVYDETLAAINASRTRNAYPEIQRLDNYFLHFRAMEDTFSRLGLPFNPNDIRAKDLPTDLNGVTADLKPGQPYFASANHRKGQRTSFDLLGGLEKYLTSAKNQIYHIDDIQTLRALRNYIADSYGQAHGLEGIDMLSEEEAQEKIKDVYGSHLSTFAKFLNEEANVLAGKTALIDRGLEGIIGRRGMTFLDTVNRQVGSNMVGFNISSSLTNFLPVAQTFAKSNKYDFVKAFAQTVSNKFGSIVGKSDGFAEASPVVIRRKGADRFYRTPFQKVGDAGYVLMSAVDDISTELIARTKFNELTRKGMSEQKAHLETDKWVSRLMGDRSLGQQPQLYNSKTLGVLTKFQLEVRNQLDSQFYDTIQEAKVSAEDIENGLARNAKIAARVASTFVQLAVVQHLFGKAFESVAGYNPAFDIISTIATALGLDDDDESEDTVLDNIEQGFLELLEDLPYTSTLTGGRIPIANALPITDFINGEDRYGNEKSRWEILGEAAPYYVLPGGYGQIKKTVQGLNMFSDEHPVAGSYTNSGNLRFPVEDTPLNRLQAGIFGQYASENAREYFDNNYAPLKEKQIQEYIDSDMPIKDYWEYREGLSGLKTLNEKGDYIGGLDLPVSTKNVLINNIADREKAIDMTGYENYPSFEEFDFAQRYPDIYSVLQEQGISVKDYKENYEETAFMRTDDYSWAANNPEKYTVSKAVTNDVAKYKQYTTDLYNIKADKDANGKSINGSRKEKVLDYINNLDVDYGARLILYKSEYPSDDTYNVEIIEYINNRNDISYDEKLAIYEELGFTVSDGYVYWD